jgi:hypothetical protein
MLKLLVVVLRVPLHVLLQVPLRRLLVMLLHRWRATAVEIRVPAAAVADPGREPRPLIHRSRCLESSTKANKNGCATGRELWAANRSGRTL